MANKKLSTSKKRPTKFNHNPTKHTQLRRRWRSWLPTMNSHLRDLLGKKEIFWKLQDIAEKNPKILNPGAFFDWMCENFIYAITVGARKFDDTDHRSRSLWVMLYQILENPGVINRRAYKALYRKERVGVSDTHFDNLVGYGKEKLSQIQIRSDLRKIEDANERIRRLVNKEIAHFARPGGIRRRPTYPELDNALDTIVKLLHKYNLLLTARNEEFISGVGIWMNVLKEPWMAP